MNNAAILLCDDCISYGVPLSDPHILLSHYGKLGSDSSPLNASGETSFAPQTLLGRVKPVCANAQGGCAAGRQQSGNPYR